MKQGLFGERKHWEGELLKENVRGVIVSKVLYMHYENKIVKFTKKGGVVTRKSYKWG
jgi:hypothetical protein